MYMCEKIIPAQLSTSSLSPKNIIQEGRINYCLMLHHSTDLTKRIERNKYETIINSSLEKMIVFTI